MILTHLQLFSSKKIEKSAQNLRNTWKIAYFNPQKCFTPRPKRISTHVTSAINDLTAQSTATNMSRPPVKLGAKKLSQNCHPERSEGSGLPKREILRCAQNDVIRFEIVIKYIRFNGNDISRIWNYLNFLWNI